LNKSPHENDTPEERGVRHIKSVPLRSTDFRTGSTPRLALVGYGKMGRELEQVAGERGFEIGAVLDVHNNAQGEGLTEAGLAGVDVCVDFTAPTTVVDNIRRIAACGKDMVVGTTGWYDQLDAVRRVVADAGVGLVYAPNFSVGVNLLFKLTEYAGRLVDRLAEYDPYVLELHHNQKADSPSGTALQLGHILLGAVGRKQTLRTTAAEGPIPPESLHVASVRAGHIFGRHTVGFDSPFDTLELTHTARSRRGFAAGALLAAAWVRGRKGVFHFADVL